MANTARLDTKKQGLIPSLKLFFQSILEMDTISAMLVPRHLPMKNMVMPALITSPDYIDGIDPLAPAFPNPKSMLDYVDSSSRTRSWGPSSWI